MTDLQKAKLPENIILAPTEPIYAVLRRTGGVTGRDRRLGLFRHVLIPACGNRAALAGPALGAPAAALLVEHLASSGVKRMLLLGVCGSLVPDLRIGDLFIPTGGISEEGTSRLYGEGEIPPPDPSLLNRILKACHEEGASPRQGLIWTTDAPHRETPDKIARFRGQEALAVDMEFTALSAVAGFHRIQFAALMVVSDENFMKTHQSGFMQKKFQGALNTSAKITTAVFL
ncbi:MAG: hypothetical protein AABY87_14115 [bacterium]